MGILGGLDVGFGSNMQVVRTNYLCVKDSGAALTANAANFLSMYNRHIREQAMGNTGLVCVTILHDRNSHAWQDWANTFCAAPPPSLASCSVQGHNQATLFTRSGRAMGR